MWPRIVQVSVDSEIPTYHLRFSNHAQHTSLFGCAASTDISGSYHRGHRCRSMQPTVPPFVFGRSMDAQESYSVAPITSVEVAAVFKHMACAQYSVVSHHGCAASWET